MKKFYGPLAIAALAVMATPAFAQIKIGSAGPMTGQYAAFGEQLKRGAEMAVEEINAAGGIKGFGKIELVIEDDATSPTQAVNAVNKVINNDKVDLLMASCASATTLAIVDIHTRAEVPNLNSCSSSKLITDRGSKWIFRTQFVSTFHAAGVAEMAVKILGAKNIGVMNDTNEYGRAAAEAVMERLKAIGKPAATQQVYNAGDKTFSAQLLKFKELNVDTVAFFGYYQEAALILRQAKQLGLSIRVISTDVLQTPTFLELAGDAANGVVLAMAFTADSSDARAQEFVRKYKARWNNAPNSQSAMGYDSVYILKDALERAGTKDKAKVRDALAKTCGFIGVTGRTCFNERGDDTRPFITAVIDNGKYVPWDEYKKK